MHFLFAEQRLSHERHTKTWPLLDGTQGVYLPFPVAPDLGQEFIGYSAYISLPYHSPPAYTSVLCWRLVTKSCPLCVGVNSYPYVASFPCICYALMYQLVTEELGTLLSPTIYFIGSLLRTMGRVVSPDYLGRSWIASSIQCRMVSLILCHVSRLVERLPSFTSVLTGN